MIYPTIKGYRQDRRSHLIAPLHDRPQFLGQSSLDTRWNRYEPKVNVRKEDNLYEMELTLPGFSKEDITVTIEGDILRIEAEKAVEEKSISEYLIKEFDTEMVERRFVLGKNIGHEKVSAFFNNGILKLIFTDVPLADEESYKQVKVL